MFSQADAYERFMGRWSRLLTPAIVLFSEIRETDVVLEVGSGTGALALAIRDAARNGRVTGVDPSSDFVRHARESRSDPGVAFVVGDARSLQFSDALFDKTVSVLVLNFVPEPGRVLKQMIRVTKPGGIVTAAVWDYAEGMQMLRAFWDEATALDPASAAADEARMPLCRQGELGAVWRGEGLADVEEKALTVPLHFASFEDYWGPFLLGQGPAGAYVAGLASDRQRALEQRLRERLIGAGPDRSIEMQGRVWAVKGTVPPR